MAGERALHGPILAVIANSEVTMPELIGRLTPHYPDTKGSTMMRALELLIEAGMVEASVSSAQYGETKYRLTGRGRGDPK